MSIVTWLLTCKNITVKTLSIKKYLIIFRIFYNGALLGITVTKKWKNRAIKG